MAGSLFEKFMGCAKGCGLVDAVVVPRPSISWIPGKTKTNDRQDNPDEFHCNIGIQTYTRDLTNTDCLPLEFVTS